MNEWLNLETGEIFRSGYLDGLFFALVQGINWSKVEILEVARMKGHWNG